MFSWLVFPLAMFGSLAVAIAALNRGNADAIAAAAGLGFGYIVVVCGERLYPYVEEWNQSHDDVATDTAWLGSLLATGALTGPVTQALGAAIAIALSTRFGFELWPGHWSLPAQLALALVVVEFVQYWTHRLEHQQDWLWRFHATHHSAPRLYWLNAARFHVVDIVLLNVGYLLPLVALGADGPVIALWVVASSVHGISQHANMQMRCGPLNWIFSMAELHRWHHSRLEKESNTNFGQTLIVWDIVFGTRFLPSDRKPPADIGIAGLSAFPMTWWAQMCSPMQWARIKRNSEAAHLE